MKHFTILVLFLASIAIHAQNLVPNGSFETLDPAATSCPTTETDSFAGNYKPQYWVGYTDPKHQNLDLSGDYFYPCPGSYANPFTSYSTQNWQGCELPLDGHAYCGFLAFAKGFNLQRGGSEYIMNKQIPLTSGTKYYVEFYVSSAEGNGASNLK
ncbi:MAG TPA: hypothetical protein DGG95_15005 [Cytophagales bacterium]|jgi:hypothetical protein|nr:hypothetical protein [Cytophagales bacterium]